MTPDSWILECGLGLGTRASLYSQSDTIWNVEIVNFPPNWSQVGARGACPHCSYPSYFRPVAASYIEQVGQAQRICDGAQCESCKEFVLVVGQRVPSTGDNNFSLVAVYPLGKPNDFVDETVPPEIASDFREALRCQWIEAHKPTVTMCRRALQASAIALGASGERLIDQIDYLATKGTITSPLKALAHEVRVTGNVGAHPDRDGLSDVKKEDAVDMVEFTREFFHHVYVMPAKLKARAPKAAEKTS